MNWTKNSFKEIKTIQYIFDIQNDKDLKLKYINLVTMEPTGGFSVGVVEKVGLLNNVLVKVLLNAMISRIHIFFMLIHLSHQEFL